MTAPNGYEELKFNPFKNVKDIPNLDIFELMRFLRRIKTQNMHKGECWEWMGYRDSETEYGIFCHKGKRYYAHRILYKLLRGDLDKKLVVDHICNNRKCVNPFHLQQITRWGNLLRSDAPSALNSRKTECMRGHKFTVENTRYDKYQNRYCNQCQKDKDAVRQIKRHHEAQMRKNK